MTQASDMFNHETELRRRQRYEQAKQLVEAEPAAAQLEHVLFALNRIGEPHRAEKVGNQLADDYAKLTFEWDQDGEFRGSPYVLRVTVETLPLREGGRVTTNSEPSEIVASEPRCMQAFVDEESSVSMAWPFCSLSLGHAGPHQAYERHNLAGELLKTWNHRGQEIGVSGQGEQAQASAQTSYGSLAPEKKADPCK